MVLVFIFICSPKPRNLSLKLMNRLSLDKDAGLSDAPSSYLKSRCNVSFKRNTTMSKNSTSDQIEDLSDSGIERVCDDITDTIPTCPRVPPEGADSNDEDIQTDQHRANNQQYHQQLSIVSEKKQNNGNGNGNGNSSINISFVDFNNVGE